MNSSARILVVSAHAADFCIRAGGALARYATSKARVRVVVLSFGARGESNELWVARHGQTTEEEVALVRRGEAEAAARILGVEVAFCDYADQPLTFDHTRLMALVREIRTLRPSHILTHPQTEPYNPDHARACQAVLDTAYYATLAGVEPDLPPVSVAQILMFEPTQPLAETTAFNPDTFIDITDVMDQKMRAVAEFRTQPYHVDRYRARAAARAAQAAYVSGDTQVKFAEAFQRYTPWVGRLFP